MTQLAGNLRVRRTQKLLREALIDLIEERSFDAITVGELAARAMVSRAAFYRNYRDKYDLVEQIFDQAMSALLDAAGDLGQEHPAQSWVAFFEHIAENARLYRALLGRKGSPWFARKLRTALADLVHQRARLATPNHVVHPVSDDFVPDMVATVFVEAITWWLDQDMPYTPREIATRSSLLAAAIFKEASTWK